MKKFIVSVLPVFLIACGGEEKVEETAVVEEVVEDCMYSYDSDATVLTWTGFKLTEKIGVNGTFNEINVTANNDATDMYGVLNGATFNIPVASIDSQEPTRDPKLRKNFFGVMTETDEINGTVNSINETEASVSITLNQVSVDYSGDVTVDGEKITFVTTINMEDFSANHAVDSLNVVCLEKHTGPDGESKLWSDVDIAISTTLIKTCK